MKKRIIGIAIGAVTASFLLTGCGDAISDIIGTETVTRTSEIVIDQDTIGKITIPSLKGNMSSTPATPTEEDTAAETEEDYTDNAEDAAAEVTAAAPSASITMNKYPKHGEVTFSGNVAIYQPNPGFYGEDFFSFEFYDSFKDEIDEYNIKVKVNKVDVLAEPKLVAVIPAQARSGESYEAKVSLIGIDKNQTNDFVFYGENMPIWLNIDEKTGNMSGTPSDGDVGKNENIIIHADSSQFSLETDPKTITVLAKIVNKPPVISGTPTTTVKSGEHYSFIPTVKDDDSPKESLVFEIANKPSWADFDTVTGELSGDPVYIEDDNSSSEDINETTANLYTDIVISVKDDSDNISSLPPFDIQVEK